MRPDNREPIIRLRPSQIQALGLDDDFTEDLGIDVEHVPMTSGEAFGVRVEVSAFVIGQATQLRTTRRADSPDAAGHP